MGFRGVLVACSAACSALAAAALPSCDSDRPNSWAEHRTLHLPTDMAATASDAWVDALCCVYTHVEEQASLTRARMTTYDGSTRWYDGDDGDDVMERAYDAICGMSMGGDDCDSQATCVADALAGDDGECADSDTWRFKKKPWKSCAWVAKKPAKRCKKKGATFKKAKKACLAACGKC